MISREQAVPLLRPLAAPTMEALSFAAAQTQLASTATQAGRSLCRAQVLGMVDGVVHWGHFSSSLVHNYGRVAGVVEKAGGHPLSHVWLVDGQLEIHLKSDIANIDHEQLSMPIPESGPPGSPHFIALTSRRDKAGIRKASFQLMTRSGAQWRIPLESLVEVQVSSIKPTSPRAKVTSIRRPAKSKPDDGSR
jgi:hypothetical protein